jgi:hypothetical protein
MKSPSEVQNRIATIVNAWSNLRPTKSFYGLTLEQFKAAVQSSLDARNAVAEMKNNHLAATVQRATADAASLTTLRNVVNAVIADPVEGEDGELYKAMGFVRKSERASGLTRAKRNGVTALTAPAAKAA